MLDLLNYTMFMAVSPSPTPNPNQAILTLNPNPNPNPNQVILSLNPNPKPNPNPNQVIGLRIFVLTLLNSLNFNPPPNQFSDFHNPAWSIYQVSNIMALTAILMWLKLLRYLQLSARLSQLTQTIARAALDVANFLII